MSDWIKHISLYDKDSGSNLCTKIERHKNFILIRDVLSVDQIEILMKYWDSVEVGTQNDKNVWDVKSNKKTKIESSNRSVEIIGIPIGKFPFLTKVLSDCFNCVISNHELEGPHYFTRYPVGGKHSPHSDNIGSFQRDKVISLVLNNNYLGGELDIDGEIVPNDSNMVIIYNGSLKHQVKNVIFGSRFVITECATKKLTKR